MPRFFGGNLVLLFYEVHGPKGMLEFFVVLISIFLFYGTGFISRFVVSFGYGAFEIKLLLQMFMFPVVFLCRTHCPPFPYSLLSHKTTLIMKGHTKKVYRLKS